MKKSRNANTEHSRKLRATTNAEWQKKLTADNRFAIKSIDSNKIRAIKSGLAAIDGTDQASKLVMLIEHYNRTKDL
ncbi:hypothetical protein A1D23_03785 [Chelonobacter oris]|uniref:hypothetical protein n=1 Tax=Chelonobacter oris TaxID=505317 RepID=UPI002447FC65|nr:hypothetical protein [Chelonobacter oris]MDH2999226.1 hypothetical protein [Chelonobacter oris]